MNLNIKNQSIQAIIQKMNPEIRNQMLTRLTKLKTISETYKDEELEEYTCEKCRDLRYVIDKGGSATPCECKEMLECEKRLKESEIGSQFKDKTFKNYDYKRHEQYSEGMVTSLRYCEELLESLKTVSIFFSGQPGAGKTHLSAAIANKLIENGIPIIYMPYREIITKLKQNIMDEKSYNAIIDKYKKQKVLLIDDLFKGKITESDINIIFEIVNYRYLNELPMIISSEKTPREILEIDEAIGSRIIQMSSNYIVKFAGKGLNYRINAYSNEFY